MSGTQDPEQPPRDKPEVLDSTFPVAGELVQRSVTYRSSPYPPPEDLRQYEEILPSFTERLFALTERETEHRIGQERLQNEATIELARRGQHYALIVVLALIAVGGAAALTGHSGAGLGSIAAAAVALVSAFVAPNIFARMRQGKSEQPRSGQPQLPPNEEGA